MTLFSGFHVAPETVVEFRSRDGSAWIKIFREGSPVGEALTLYVNDTKSADKLILAILEVKAFLAKKKTP